MRLSRTFLSIASFTFLAACAGEQASSVSLPPTLVDPYLGAKLVSSQDTLILHEDGTISGISQGQAISGRFEADSREICITYTAPSRLTGASGCKVPVISGRTITFTSRAGADSPVYTISR